MNKTDFKSGFVTLIGRPNVGKSTLMNEMIGQKVAIMSDKPQTTRHRIQGVYTSDDTQVVFLDTPGIHKPKSKLGNIMVETTMRTLKEVELILFLVDAQEGFGRGDEYIIEHLKNIQTPVFLVVNKIDQVHPDRLLPFIDRYRTLYPFQEVVPVSALQGNNVSTLIKLIKDILPKGPRYYPEDQMTDHPEQFIMAELIREKALQLTRDEIPHSLAVMIESIREEEKNGILYVYAVIFTERLSQKKILIGKQGAMLKEIGRRARQDIEVLLGSKIYLDLWIKVKKDWRNEDRWLRQFGFQNRD